MCLLSNNIKDYHIVSQGKTTIPNVDDGEELNLTDVISLYLKSLMFECWYFLVILSKF